jgi:hypothetical protein
MSNSGARKRLAEAQRGDEAGGVEALLCQCHDRICPIHNEESDGYIEFQVDDLLALLAARDADQRRLGAEAVVAAVEGLHVAAIDNVCAMCRVVDLPCPTIRAARAAAQQVSER